MPTIKDDINQIRKTLNSVSPDTRLSNKFIYDKLMDVVKVLIRRETEIRKIYSSTEVFTPLECVELEQVPVESCSNLLLPTCKVLYRSKKKLPQMFETPAGSIAQVFNILGMESFTQTDMMTYTSIMKREYRAPVIYFWVQAGYLYIPAPITEVMVSAFFLNESETKNFKSKTKSCHKFLDATSPIPQWLRMDAIRLVVETLANITRRLPEDEDVNEDSRR